VIKPRDFSYLYGNLVGISDRMLRQHLELYAQDVARLNAIENAYPLTIPENSVDISDGFHCILDARVQDLDLSLSGTIANLLVAVQHEAEEHGVTPLWVPYLGDGDFWTVNRGLAVNIPWYLANVTLWRLANRQVETAYTVEQVLRALRHELGHVINYAHELWETDEWVRIFGNFLEPYVDSYKVDDTSKNYVEYLTAVPAQYSQKHPDEDWAETFARWLDPRGGWEEEYAQWPVALGKLHYVHRVMSAVGTTPPTSTCIGRRNSYKFIKGTVRQLLGAPPETPQFTPSGWSEHAALLRQEPSAYNDVVLHELYFDGLMPGTCKSSALYIERASSQWGNWDAYLFELRVIIGSSRGWALTVWDPHCQRLRNVLVEGISSGMLAGCPVLLAIDTHEHAYASDYGSRKDIYAAAVFANLNWAKMNQRLILSGCTAITNMKESTDVAIEPLDEVAWNEGFDGDEKFAGRGGGLVVVERDVISTLGKSFKRKYWVSPADVRATDRVVKSEAATAQKLGKLKEAPVQKPKKLKEVLAKKPEKLEEALSLSSKGTALEIRYGSTLPMDFSKEVLSIPVGDGSLHVAAQSAIAKHHIGLPGEPAVFWELQKALAEPAVQLVLKDMSSRLTKTVGSSFPGKLKRVLMMSPGMMKDRPTYRGFFNPDDGSIYLRSDVAAGVLHALSAEVGISPKQLGLARVMVHEMLHVASNQDARYEGHVAGNSGTVMEEASTEILAHHFTGELFGSTGISKVKDVWEARKLNNYDVVPGVGVTVAAHVSYPQFVGLTASIVAYSGGWLESGGPRDNNKFSGELAAVAAELKSRQGAPRSDKDEYPALSNPARASNDDHRTSLLTELTLKKFGITRESPQYQIAHLRVSSRVGDALTGGSFDYRVFDSGVREAITGVTSQERT
jgi:superoxide dismutase